jgi:hypothetical protein
MLQIALSKTVEVNTAAKGIPVWLKILGLTTIIYIVAKKVLHPAAISVLIFVIVIKTG